jgi:hypothetical protein
MSPVNGAGNDVTLGGSVPTNGGNGTCSTPLPNGGQSSLTCSEGYMPSGSISLTCDNGNWAATVCGITPPRLFALWRATQLRHCLNTGLPHAAGLHPDMRGHRLRTLWPVRAQR